MNITIVCDILGKENNGTTIAAMNLIRHLKKQGHNVTIVCNDEDKKNDKGYFVVPELKIPIVTTIIHNNGVKVSRLNKKILQEAINGADLVHLLLPFKLSHYAVKYCKKNNIKTTASFHCQAENVTCHAHLKNCKSANKLIYKYFYHRVYKYVDMIHYPTQFIRDVFESIVGKTNGLVISNGVNMNYDGLKTNKPESLKDKFVILNVGRYCNEKNQQVLLQAINYSKYKNKIHLILAGFGPDKRKLIKLSKKFKLNTEFNFYSHDELRNIIRYVDLYVHPADIEIESISCIEAISCGLVPIVSDSKRSATRYFAIDEKSIFKNNDPIDLANKIDYWIENQKEKEKYSQKYINNSNFYNIAYCMDQMEKMMKNLTNKEVVYEK